MNVRHHIVGEIDESVIYRINDDLGILFNSQSHQMIQIDKDFNSQKHQMIQTVITNLLSNLVIRNDKQKSRNETLLVTTHPKVKLWWTNCWVTSAMNYVVAYLIGLIIKYMEWEVWIAK